MGGPSSLQAQLRGQDMRCRPLGADCMCATINCRPPDTAPAELCIHYAPLRVRLPLANPSAKHETHSQPAQFTGSLL
jgi:hypothetical protein